MKTSRQGYGGGKMDIRANQQAAEVPLITVPKSANLSLLFYEVPVKRSVFTWDSVFPGGGVFIQRRADLYKHFGNHMKAPRCVPGDVTLHSPCRLSVYPENQNIFLTQGKAMTFVERRPPPCWRDVAVDQAGVVFGLQRILGGDGSGQLDTAMGAFCGSSPFM